MHGSSSTTIPSKQSLPNNNRLYYADKTVTREHFCLWDPDVAAIIPILPKSPQQTVERRHKLNSVISVSHSDLEKLDVFMDLAQNLIVVAYLVQGTPRIDLRALDGGVQPQAAEVQGERHGRECKL